MRHQAAVMLVYPVIIFIYKPALWFSETRWVLVVLLLALVLYGPKAQRCL